ncbi:MAG TPA: enoyl-CoA hydratase/isomerase family protein [Sporichthyaceae bacterium]|nr:enoyl-CoA hydratase/isomerase family protein [Sporichthyaceae bacterium]
MIELEMRDEVALVRPAHGKVNALDVELLDALTGTIDKLADSGARAVVLYGTGSTFCAGVDLRRVLAEGEDYAQALVGALTRTFRAWFTTPLPVVAAVNGHAIAGGCVLMAAADRRLAADTPTARIGASEIRVGVPFPASAMELVVAAAGADRAEEIILGAALYSPTDAIEVGLVHRVCPADWLLEEAIVEARVLGSGSPIAYARAKQYLRADATARIDAGAAYDVEVGRIWGAPDTRDRIAAAMAHR